MADGHAKYRLLAGIPSEDCQQLLAKAKEHAYDEGDIVLEEGTKQDSLYLIEEGGVEVLKVGSEPGGSEGAGVEESLTRLSAGNFFGDLSVFDPGPASASVRTTRPTRLLVLAGQDVIDFLRAHPVPAVRFYRNLLSELATRLRRLDQKLVQRIAWVHDDASSGQQGGGS